MRPRCVTGTPWVPSLVCRVTGLGDEPFRCHLQVTLRRSSGDGERPARRRHPHSLVRRSKADSPDLAAVCQVQNSGSHGLTTGQG
ncbi:MAG TPA: hypothetical protein VK997_14490, partial [Deferrisomatales bacterium]|nr:hypothetical protein [Deferrisomatales bacterium]